MAALPPIRPIQFVKEERTALLRNKICEAVTHLKKTLETVAAVKLPEIILRSIPEEQNNLRELGYAVAEVEFGISEHALLIGIPGLLPRKYRGVVVEWDMPRAAVVARAEAEEKKE